MIIAELEQLVKDYRDLQQQVEHLEYLQDVVHLLLLSQDGSIPWPEGFSSHVIAGVRDRLGFMVGGDGFRLYEKRHDGSFVQVITKDKLRKMLNESE